MHRRLKRTTCHSGASLRIARRSPKNRRRAGGVAADGIPVTPVGAAAGGLVAGSGIGTADVVISLREMSYLCSTFVWPARHERLNRAAAELSTARLWTPTAMVVFVRTPAVQSTPVDHLGGPR